MEKRNYLYKGKCTKKSTHAGEWVIGSLIVCDNGETLIVQALNDHNMMTFHVQPKTVCKITDYVDKKDNKISEGDILQSDVYPFLNDENERNYYGVVVCANGGLYVETVRSAKTSVRGCSEGNTETLDEFVDNGCEIIGNIFDNKELLNPNYKF